ncbi:uncharacterized protein SCHCODRAFT_02682277 [Schizophyllum commune H4-8]|nr:uncharacterized protein SCHCODRAFT_02682277 [Schizophyllum commune H4-8]KAI5899242.1 hypothetical protein SCHCODRAFT_02682277 [Schizophyllum commune H4-8]
MQTAYLRAAISVRSQQIAALEREVQINRMILSSPIRRLSPELLAHIMVLCISTTRCAPRHALALAHVCRSWRATAFMKADLWTRLSISWAQACHADAIAHTAAWFSRARSRPMSFSIFKYRDFLDFCRPPPSLCPLLKFVLLQHEPQLLELHIALHVLWLPTFLSCARGSLPMLRKLHLDVQYTAHYISKGFYFPLDALPRLQTLHVRGANMLIPSHDPLCNVLLLPCAQLKNLQLDGVMGTHEWGEIFLECTSLVRARISSLKGRDPPQWPSSDGAVPSEVVVFRHLTQSELYYKELPGAVLNVARFPALTTLILGYLPKARHGEMVEDDEATWTVHRGLAQHLKSLTSLTVIGFDFEHPQTEDAFRYILQSLTLLTHLAFESCTLWSLDILSFLTTPDSVPLLEELLFYNMEIKESFLCSQDELELRKDIWDVAIFEETYAFIEKFLRERGLAESSRLRLFQFRLLSFEEDNVEDEFELALRRLVWLAARCLTEKGLEIDLDAIPIDKLDIIPVNSDSESEDSATRSFPVVLQD